MLYPASRCFTKNPLANFSRSSRTNGLTISAERGSSYASLVVGLNNALTFLRFLSIQAHFLANEKRVTSSFLVHSSPMSDDVENQRITIVPTQILHRDHVGDTALTMRRTLSIHTPAVPPSARLPIEFRTLSLHLEHEKVGPQQQRAQRRSQRSAPRPSHPAPVPPKFRRNADSPPFGVRPVRTRLA